MNFDNVVNELELLIGYKLKAINQSTPSIVIEKVDKQAKVYFVSANDEKSKRRTFIELQTIWNELVTNGFVNVDQALFGGGSSRNKPETILANMPFIQHFKYKKRKYLLLRNTKVHEIAQLGEVVGGELRSLRKKIDTYYDIDFKQLAASYAIAVNKVNFAIDNVLTKYPGDAVVSEARDALDKLDEINQTLKAAYVSIEVGEPHSLTTRTTSEDQYRLSTTLTTEVIPVNVKNWISSEDIIESEVNTGLEGSKDEDDLKINVELVVDEYRDRLKIRQITPTLSLIYDRVEYNEIDLRPDFQRKDRIWSNVKKSKLIESILMGLPLPIFYFAENKNGIWIVVDGLQRITTIYDFIKGRFSLTKLDEIVSLENFKFSDLNRVQQRKIRECSISAHLMEINEQNQDDVVTLFHRINTYGVQLSAQEVRSALKSGSSVRFLRYLAASSVFRRVTNGKINPSRQKDMEVCLGALAYMVNGYEDFKSKTYDEFLRNTMSYLNSYEFSTTGESEVIDDGLSKIQKNKTDIFYINLLEKFNKGLLLAEAVFGKSAFRKEFGDSNRLPVNKPLFELIVSCFSFVDEPGKKTIMANSGKLIEIFYTSISEDSDEYARWDTSNDTVNQGFEYSISQSTGKRLTILYRFKSFLKMVEISTGVSINLNSVIKND
jgi:hypothetical protein